MADDLDLDGLEPTQAVERMRAALERQQAAASKAEQELASLRAAQRQSEVQQQLREIGAPEQVAKLYPADARTDREAVKAFLKDSIGFDADVNSNWAGYEQRRDAGEAPPAPPDEWVALEKKLHEDMLRITGDSRFYAPTDQDQQEMDLLKRRVLHELLPSLDRDVETGRIDGPLIRPEGFGGRIDPPAWANRARQGLRSV